MTRLAKDGNYVDSGDEDVVAAVLGRVVRAAVPVDAPVARVRRGHALGARGVRRAVEEREVRRHKVRPRRHAHRQFRREVICRREAVHLLV